MPNNFNKIPDRWEDYTNMGRQIPGTRFIAFKVPLKKVLLDRLPRTVAKFDTRTLVDYCSGLGLVIDLTNTDRYYDPQDLTNLNIQYEKLHTQGHVIPSEAIVRRFFKVVEEFLEANERNDKLIGVHCTHGVNRTGYMICRYMIQQLGVPPDQAIVDFNSARGHELERKNYLTNLRKAPWLKREYATSPYSYSDSRRRSRTPRGPNAAEDVVSPPPYMPYQSWRRKKFSSGGGSYHQDDNGPSPPEPDRRRTRSLTRHDQGWSPYGPQGPPQWKLEESRRRSSSSHGKRTFFTDDAEETRTGRSPEESEPPFRFGKEYYERYFKGQVLPQYDLDFYSRGGGGVGPHRPQPRGLPPVEGDGRRPRQYRGPRPYQSPPPREEPYSFDRETPKRRHVISPQETRTPATYSARKTPQEPPSLVPVRGPGRNPLSPGADTEAFSPEYDSGRRRNSRRFQPY